MAWETRKRGGRYYTRSRKVNGRVIREYVGGGIIGELAACLDAEEHAERLAKEEALRAERARLAEIGDTVDVLCKGIDRLVTAVLQAMGYHRHHRGEWRKRRKGNRDGGKEGVTGRER